MILADTSVIVRFWRSPTDVQRAVLGSGQVVICGVTRAELLHGARDERDLVRIEAHLALLPEVATQPGDWTALGRNLFRLRSRGLTVPFSDALIATLAIQYGHVVWTYDDHYALMQTVLASLQLFQETS